MNIETIKTVEECKEFILNSEKNLFKKSIEVYLMQGYALSLIKAQIKDFYTWVDDNLPFTISTANRRLLLYNTARERELVNASLRDLNNNLINQLEVIWKEIEGVKTTPLIKQVKVTERFIETEIRTIKRMHVDREPFYAENLDSKDRIKEVVLKHKRESYDIEEGIEKTLNVLKDWLSQFNLWKKTVKSLNNQELNERKRLIEKKIKEGKENIEG